MAPRSARIVSEENGVGLSRDIRLLSEVLVAMGWSVTVVPPSAVPETPVLAQFFLESPVDGAMPWARWNAILPNAELWRPVWTPLLSRLRVWAKTEDAAKAFRDLGARVWDIGFTSADHHDSMVHREHSFLCVTGRGQWRRAEALVAMWKLEWPSLTVIANPICPMPIGAPANVIFRRERLTDDELKALQNRHLFHVYPSRYEGFGHKIHEALSCGAIVLAPAQAIGDGLSMVGVSLRMMPLPSPDGGIVGNHEVPPDAIAEAVTTVLRWSESECQARSASARRFWLSRDARFRTRVARLLDGLSEERETDGMSSGADAMGARILARLPPMAYVGRVNCVTGYGEAARHQIDTLRRHGLRLRILDAGSVGDPDPTHADAFVRNAITSDEVDDVKGTIVHLTPNCAEDFLRESRVKPPRPWILVSVWETTRLPERWIGIANNFDQVWCATHWQAGVYRASGVAEDKLRVVPFAVDPRHCPVDGPAMVGVRRGDEYVFGAAFQWTERKAPGTLIRAYLRAFREGEPVLLVVKSYEGHDAESGVEARVNAIAESMDGLPGTPPRVQVISRRLTRGDMLSFYRAIDCYVSAHRGEGFGLPIVESLLVGKPVIATDWSAPAEYARGFYQGVEYGMEAPHSMAWQPFYEDDQRWAAPRERSLMARLREAYSERIAGPPRALVVARFASLMEEAGIAARDALEAL